MTETLEATYGLSPVQQGMLFHHLSHPHSGVDIEQIVASLVEDLDPAALRNAWEQVAERHAVLRTSFRWENVEEPVQQVHRRIEIPIAIEDWSDLSVAEQTRRLAERLAADRERGFDLREAPLVRLALFRLAAQRWELLWTFPHILLDGRSFPIVLDEVFSLYDAGRRGATIALPTPPPYRDHVAHLARLDLAEAEQFWRARLAGFRAPTPLPGSPTASPSTGRGESERALSEETTSALARVAREIDVSVGTIVQGAFGLLLGRMSGETDVVFGATRAGRATSVPGAEGVVGLFIATLPVRVAVNPAQSFADWLRALRASERETRAFEHTPLVELQGWSELRAGAPLFESLLVFDHSQLDSQMRAKGAAYENRRFRLLERTNYALTLYAYAEPRLLLKLAFDEPRFDADAAARMLDHLAHLLAEIARDPAQPVAAVSLLSAAERERLLQTWNDTATEYPREACVHHLIEAQAARTPDAVAILFRDQSLRYGELNERSNRLAHHLRGLGVGPDVRVGVFAERSIELMIGLLAIHKAGGAYVPLDPAYPRDRIAFMIEDADVPVLLTQSHLVSELPGHRARVVRLDVCEAQVADAPATNPVTGATPSNLAYVIYTSGSTGKPKGVMVEHRNVVNFFAGMDARIPHDGADRTWLAVTSLSFDISVLELFWTLARGFRVVLYEDERRAATEQASNGRFADRPIQFSLMYFASEEAGGDDQYRLLLEGAKFADTHDFAAVWTPERHFHAFGGLYPNPSVASAALATITSRIGLRAGSVVIPLHHPARIAEEWALVDNLSGGRVGISFASGWQPRDFVLGPDKFKDARRLMIEGIEQVRRLWRGDALSFPGPNGDLFEVKTLPRPIQPELPVWLTAAGTPETFRKAGEMGAHILTHLLGQSLDEVSERLKIYRDAWKQAGHPGEGHVTLMLHTFVGDDDATVRDTVRRPMMDYLGSSVGLIRNFATTWTAFKKRADGGTAAADLDLNDLSAEEMEGLLEYSFERYFDTSALFGTTERCMAMVDRLKGLGVDEVACLIDFGVETDRVLAHLEHLNRLREMTQPRSATVAPASVGELIAQHRVTHLQCTPSLASMLMLDEDARAALGSLQAWMIGGEAFPAALAAQIRSLGAIQVLNMYGPTETTIWSSIHAVDGAGESIPIGRPIANTRLYVLDATGEPVPIGVAGELYIGGDGVTRGYLNRPELTAERFVPDPFRAAPGARLYRTGDLARWRADGVMEFLGRIDHQVKIRGHRIELGEIEAALAEHPGVREVVVVAREDVPGDVRLVAYLIPRDSHAPAWADAAALAKELRESLRERLPEPMLPAHFVCLDAFPQTPNRKIDRKALPAPADAAVPAPSAEAPRAPSNEIENAIVQIWREVLQIDRVGTEDNFFDLGGHSLLAVKTHRRLCEVLPRRVSITDLFRFPTVRALAEYVSDAGGSGPTLQQSQDRAELRKSALARRRTARGPRRDGSEESDA